MTLTNALAVNVQSQADGSAYPKSECPMYLPYAHSIHHHLPAPHDHDIATRLLSPGQYIYCRDNVRAQDPWQIGNKEAGDDDDIRLTLKRISQDFSDCGLHNDNYTKFFSLKKFRFRACIESLKTHQNYFTFRLAILTRAHRTAKLKTNQLWPKSSISPFFKGRPLLIINLLPCIKKWEYILQTLCRRINAPMIGNSRFGRTCPIIRRYGKYVRYAI